MTPDKARETLVFPSATLSPRGKTTIIYGDSGNGKTTALYHLAERVYKRTGLPVRVISFEDSSKLIFDPLIRAGAVEYVGMDGTNSAIGLMRELRQGVWRGPDGGLQRSSDWAGKVAAYFIEGLTTMCETLLQECADGHRFLREQRADAFTVPGIERDHACAPASLTSYNFVQVEALATVRAMGYLPVPMVVWTAHEVSAADDAMQPIRGPALVGAKKTKRVQAYVGTLLHLDRVAGGRRGCYFEPHPDPQLAGLMCPAKITLSPSDSAAVQQRYPKGAFEVTLLGGELAEFLLYLYSRAGQAETAGAEEQHEHNVARNQS